MPCAVSGFAVIKKHVLYASTYAVYILISKL